MTVGLHERLKWVRRATIALALLMWAAFTWVLFYFKSDPDYTLALRLILFLAIPATAFNIFLVIHKHVMRKLQEE